MSGQPYVQGQVTVGTTATLIASPSGPGGIYLSNGSGAAVVLGGSTVTATGATAGPTLPVSTNIILPTTSPAHDLYGVVASGTTTVSFAYPGGN